MSVDNIGGTTVILGSSDIAALFGTPENTGGTATFAKVLGDALNSSIVARLAALATSVAGREQELSINAPNHIAVNVDLTSATWNTVATHEVFTVTGAVRLRIWVICTEALAGVFETMPRIRAGVETDPGFIFDWMNVADADPGFWESSSSTTKTYAVNSSGIMADVMLFDEDVGFLVGDYPFTDGTLVFHCVWEPLSAGATVVAGAGGPL